MATALKVSSRSSNATARAGIAFLQGEAGDRLHDCQRILHP
jgi:hypothetical protein